MAKHGNHEPEINNGIYKGRGALSKLNSILCDRDATPKQRLIFTVL
jgi:hypothetical protein